MTEGYIRLSRKILDWEWIDNSITFHVFVYLLLNAYYEDGKYRGYDVKRGDVIIKLDSLAKRLCLSVSNVRTALNHLKSTNEIAIKATNKFSIVTICNYDSWQSTNNETDTQTDKQPTNNRQTTDKQPTTIEGINKEINKENNNININNNPAENEFQQGREEIEELNRQIEELRKQNEELRKEKKPRAKPIPKSLGGKAQALFIDYYKEKNFSDQDYYWEAKDGSAMKKILDKIISAREGKGLSCDDDSVLQALKMLLESVTDEWILQHFNPSIINSKYNDIVANAKKDYAEKKESRLITFAVSLGPEQEAKIYGIDAEWFKDADDNVRANVRKGNLQRIEKYMAEYERR